MFMTSSSCFSEENFNSYSAFPLLLRWFPTSHGLQTVKKRTYITFKKNLCSIKAVMDRLPCSSQRCPKMQNRRMCESQTLLLE